MKAIPASLQRTRLLSALGLSLPEDDVDDIVVAEIERQLLTLTAVESFVVRCRFNDPKLTLKDIGSLLGITPGRVRQREAKGLRKMRHPVRLRPLLRAIGVPQCW